MQPTGVAADSHRSRFRWGRCFPRSTSLDATPAWSRTGRRGSMTPAVQRQLRDVLTSAIDELPPHYRAAIVLRDVEAWSTTEVADALGIPVQTVKTRAHRARLLLRKRLATFMEAERLSETEVPTRASEG